ncbi:MAG: RNA-binding cell elongation regulator Jag/EloR [Bacillota bacterium]
MSINKYTDSTIESAIQKGLKDLGLTLEEVDVTVLKAGGIFSKPCVQLTKKEVVVAETPVIAEEAEVVSEVVEEAVVEEVVAEEKPAYKKSAPRHEKRELTDAEKQHVAEVAENSRSFVDILMGYINPGASVTYNIIDDEICIDIEGEGAGKIIGYRGETLEALQYVTLVCCNKQEQSYIRYNMDANGYRKKRKETLTALARRLARKAAQTSSSIELEPMSPLERRIIHTALAEDTFVKTESAGEGKFRHVVIVPNRKNNNRDRRNGGYNNRDRGDRRNNRRDYSSNSDSAPREYVNKYDQPDPVYVPKPEVEEVPAEVTFGTTSDFRKKGAGKTRSFGAKNKRF